MRLLQTKIHAFSLLLCMVEGWDRGDPFDLSGAITNRIDILRTLEIVLLFIRYIPYCPFCHARGETDRISCRFPTIRVTRMAQTNFDVYVVAGLRQRRGQR